MIAVPLSRRQLQILQHLIGLLTLVLFIICNVTGIVPGEAAFANFGDIQTRAPSSTTPLVVVQRRQRQCQWASRKRKDRGSGHGSTLEASWTGWTRTFPAGRSNPGGTSTQQRRQQQTSIPWLHRERSRVRAEAGKKVNHHRERSLGAGWEQCEDPSTGNFGRRSYWEESYSKAYRTATTNSEGRSAAEAIKDGKGVCDPTTRNDEAKSGSFAWYCTWDELEPFWWELVPPSKNNGNEEDPPLPPRILLPGVGNDPVLRDMYDAGYTDLSAFDYAPSAVDCCRSLLGEERLSGAAPKQSERGGGVRLDVADARNLSGIYGDGVFDAVLDKGTLDAVFLIGGNDKEAAYEQVRLSVSELHRVLRPGGVAVSITGVSGATTAIGEAFSSSGGWTKVRDTREGVHFTEEDGYASINIDATFLTWTRDPD